MAMSSHSLAATDGKLFYRFVVAQWTITEQAGGVHNSSYVRVIYRDPFSDQEYPEINPGILVALRPSAVRLTPASSGIGKRCCVRPRRFGGGELVPVGDHRSLGWRNWQTRRIQDPVGIISRGGSTPPPSICPGGGIGRRASLRGWCPQGRGGSNPLLGMPAGWTTRREHEPRCAAAFQLSARSSTG